MIGFSTFASSSPITLRDHELEDAKWFTKDEIKTALIDGSLKLKSPVSLSFRLLEDWFNKNEKIKLW